MKYEVLVEDSFYHIYNCGNNKEDIFIEEQNYSYFLRLVKKHLSKTSDILAYCLLKNHFHFIVKTKEEVLPKQISQSFSNLFNAYSKSINKKYGRTGSLFKDRFSRIKLDSEEYLKNLILYIHLNPTHHNFIDDFRNYKYSSYNSILSDKPTKLLRANVITLFDDKKNFIDAHKIKEVTILESITLE
ncbi:transposase [Polaribacter litorisediminis]|uniref:transposase n=1 Tax=Polaribacter litorisediminis TaxID=1908341 RepID=UPI001CC0F9BC|nr:transposase [Polaribacter litorisediminis]UAM97753.1 transposase [Polaribacter litorisediminis]